MPHVSTWPAGTARHTRRPYRSAIPTGLLVAFFTTLALAVGCSAEEDRDQQTAPTANEAVRSPLATHLGLYDPDNPESVLQQQERRAARDAQVVACMEGAGFRYEPVPIPQLTAPAVETDDVEGTDAWVAQWGFGVSTQWFTAEQVDDTVLSSPVIDTPPSEALTDPNIDYVESLSSAERERYYAALHGGPDDEESSADPSQPRGCEGEASAATSNAFLADFGDELAEMNDKIARDTTQEDANKEVRECMRRAGHDDYVDLQTTLAEFGQSAAALELRIATSSSPDSTRLDEASLQQLRDLQASEINRAMALNECGGGVLTEEQTLQQVRARYEQEFIETYRERLEPYRQMAGS